MRLGVQDIKSVFQCPNLGLAIWRVALGVILIIAGWNKFAAGVNVLNAVGANVKYVGLWIGSSNAFTLTFGILAAGSELVGGALLVIGFLFRPAAVCVIFTMVVATAMKIQVGGGLNEFGYPMLVGLTALGLLFTGPGRMSIQKD